MILKVALFCLSELVSWILHQQVLRLYPISVNANAERRRGMRQESQFDLDAADWVLGFMLAV